jgi:dipeptidyl aminopeptidase/acylaminoacyl peptidase
VADAKVFKAVVAIAPVTDLAAVKEAHRQWSDFQLVSQFIGEGPHVVAGSPARNAPQIKVPVLMFHGTNDLNVAYGQSVLMDKALEAAGVRHELVTFENLDHQLDDSAARTELLRRSDAFLRDAMHL